MPDRSRTHGPPIHCVAGGLSPLPPVVPLHPGRTSADPIRGASWEGRSRPACIRRRQLCKRGRKQALVAAADAVRKAPVNDDASGSGSRRHPYDDAAALAEPFSDPWAFARQTLARGDQTTIVRILSHESYVSPSFGADLSMRRIVRRASVAAAAQEGLGRSKLLRNLCAEGGRCPRRCRGPSDPVVVSRFLLVSAVGMPLRPTF